jgi:hypothetical protein
MLQTRTWLLGRLPFRPIIRIGCRPTPAECGPDRPAARERKIASAHKTRLHGNAVLGSVHLSWSEGDLEPGPVGAPGTSTACLVVSSPLRLPWASKDARTSPTSSSLRGPLRVKVRRTQHERMSSGLPLKADIARCSRRVSMGPEPDIQPARPSPPGPGPRGSLGTERVGTQSLLGEAKEIQAEYFVSEPFLRRVHSRLGRTLVERPQRTWRLPANPIACDDRH